MTDGAPELPDRLVERVLSSFPSGRYGWRTARGVSQDLGVAEEAVASVIVSHPELFRRSSISPAGIPLYRRRERQHSAATG